MFASAEKGNLEEVQQAVENDRTLLHKTEWEDSTLLHTAVRKQYLELSEYLIQKGIDVNAVTTGGVTPLHYAARTSHVEMIKLLIRSGAKVNAADKAGRTPLDWARIWGTPEAIELLRQHDGREGLSKH